MIIFLTIALLSFFGCSLTVVGSYPPEPARCLCTFIFSTPFRVITSDVEMKGPQTMEIRLWYEVPIGSMGVTLYYKSVHDQNYNSMDDTSTMQNGKTFSKGQV